MNTHDPYAGMPAPEPQEPDEYDEGEDPCGERALELRNDAWAKANMSYEEEDAERMGMEEWDRQMEQCRKHQEDQKGPQPF